MTRAVVANLNRQKSDKESQSSPNGSTGSLDTPHSTPKAVASPSSMKKALPHKSLPPQPSPSKELLDVPEFYIVRPAPSTSAAKIERNDRRVFINRTTMEKINVYQGSVVLIQRHDAAKWVPVLASQGNNVLEQEDDESQYPTDEEEELGSQTTVGVAWPLDRIEPNGILPQIDLVNV